MLKRAIGRLSIENRRPQDFDAGLHQVLKNPTFQPQEFFGGKGFSETMLQIDVRDFPPLAVKKIGQISEAPGQPEADAKGQMAKEKRQRFSAVVKYRVGG